MLEGKKSIAQKVVYGAMDNLGEKNPQAAPWICYRGPLTMLNLVWK